jgi:hypothetical protein
MRELTESRTEFNSIMQSYIAMIVQTEYEPFSEDFFIENGLNTPEDRVNYVPPPWAGAAFSPSFFSVYGRDEKPRRWREEMIPEINQSKKYLICDDYSANGQTLDIAIIRLVQQGVKIEDIWGITIKGNTEIKNKVVLEKGIEWRNYRKRQICPTRVALEELGFVFPSLEEGVLAPGHDY